MLEATTVWIVIAVVAATAFLLRAMFLLPRWTFEPSPVVLTALRMIPPAAFAALVAPQLLRPEGSLDLLSAPLIAGVLAALVAWRTGSVALTITVGLGTVFALGQVPALS